MRLPDPQGLYYRRCSPLSRSRSSSLSARFWFLEPALPKTLIKIGIAMIATRINAIIAAIAMLKVNLSLPL